MLFGHKTLAKIMTKHAHQGATLFIPGVRFPDLNIRDVAKIDRHLPKSVLHFSWSLADRRGRIEPMLLVVGVNPVSVYRTLRAAMHKTNEIPELGIELSIDHYVQDYRRRIEQSLHVDLSSVDAEPIGEVRPSSLWVL